MVAGSLLILAGCSGSAGADNECSPNDSDLCYQDDAGQWWSSQEAADAADDRRVQPTDDPQSPETPTTDNGSEETEEQDNDDAPTTSPPAEPEPTPSPASSDGPAQNWPPPDVPDLIYEPTEEGAEAAAEYWWATWDYARITGDTDPLEEISHENCELCTHQVNMVRSLYDEQSGWWVAETTNVGDTWTLLMAWDDSEGQATVIQLVTQGAFDVYIDGKHDETSDDQNQDVGWYTHMLFEDTHWVMADVYVMGLNQMNREARSK